MAQELSETDKLKLEYLKRTSGLSQEARVSYTRAFTETMQRNDPIALRNFMASLPALNP